MRRTASEDTTRDAIPTSRHLRKPNKSRWLLFRTHLLSDPLLCLGNRFTDVETAVRDDCLITHAVFADWMHL